MEILKTDRYREVDVVRRRPFVKAPLSEGPQKLTWPRGYKIVFMLISAEHEILNAHKYKNKQFSFLQAQVSCSKTLPCQQYIVGILIFMTRDNFMLS